MSNLRELREASGLTQLELAKRAHIDWTRLSLSESGYVQLSATEEERLRTVVLKAALEQVVKLQGVLAATI